MIPSRTEDFVRLTRTETPDGLGGQRVAWTDGETVRLAAVPRRPALRTDGGIPAPRRGVLLMGEAPLKAGDRLRRVRDGAVLRVLGDSAHCRAPLWAMHPWGQTEAEVLPDDGADPGADALL